jgi:aminoglycoside 2'-N-acetyltransferase I
LTLQKAWCGAHLAPAFRSHASAHAVEGVHVVFTADQSLVVFAAVVARTLHHNGVAYDTGYLEAVAVRADQQGRGLGRVVMDHAETLIGTRHQLGALNAVKTAADFYAARGWQRWTGHTQAASPAGASSIPTTTPIGSTY